MPFTVEPKAGASILATPNAKAETPYQRAIAAFKSSEQAQKDSIPDPVQSSPRQMNQEPPHPLDAQQGQNGLVESSSESVEPPKEVQKAPEEPLSGHYAILARKEKALRARAIQQDQAIKAREAAIQAQEQAFKVKEAEYQSKYVERDRLTQDPLSVLSELGVSYDQLTQAALNPQQSHQDIGNHPVVKQLLDELKALKDDQSNSKKAYEDNQNRAYAQALDQIRNETKQLVEMDPEFETIKSTGSVDDVVDLIERTFKEQKRLMTVEEAAKLVEDHLVEEALKISSISKIQKRLQAAQQSSTQIQKPAQTTQQQQTPVMKTLTNSVGSTRQLSARDRAILAFKGELK